MFRKSDDELFIFGRCTGNACFIVGSIFRIDYFPEMEFIFHPPSLIIIYLEATTGIEPVMRVLQTLALPLGDVAIQFG